MSTKCSSITLLVEWANENPENLPFAGQAVYMKRCSAWLMALESVVFGNAWGFSFSSRITSPRTNSSSCWGSWRTCWILYPKSSELTSTPLIGSKTTTKPSPVTYKNQMTIFVWNGMFFFLCRTRMFTIILKSFECGQRWSHKSNQIKR